MSSLWAKPCSIRWVFFKIFCLKINFVKEKINFVENIFNEIYFVQIDCEIKISSKMVIFDKIFISKLICKINFIEWNLWSSPIALFIIDFLVGPITNITTYFLSKILNFYLIFLLLSLMFCILSKLVESVIICQNVCPFTWNLNWKIAKNEKKNWKKFFFENFEIGQK